MRRHDLKQENKGLLALPMGLLAMLFVGVALLYILALSFLSRGEGFSAQGPATFGNYAKLVSPLYLKALISSLRLAFTTALLCLLIGYQFAYHMARAKPRTRTWLMLLVIIPFWTNALIRIYGWKILFSAGGPVNQVMLSMGWIAGPLKLLYTDFAVQVGTEGPGVAH